jgi:DNA-binding NarL/FixJ family response regulator
MTKIKLALAEDHKEFRKAIKRLIHLENDLEVILEAENGLHLLDQLKSKTPDIILMDIRMPKMNGIEAADRIKEEYPKIKIIAFSQYDQEENIVEMTIHGVKSFIGKEDDPEELFKAIRIVHDGGIYMTDKAASIVQRYLVGRQNSKKEMLSVLNELEKAVLKLIMEGLTSKEIGGCVNRSHRTIEDIRKRVYDKLNVGNKEQLISLLSKEFS